MDATPIDVVMEQWLIKDQIIDEELNKLRLCSNIQAKLTQDVIETQNAIDEANKDVHSIENNLANLKGDHEIIKIQLEAWRQTLVNAKDEHNRGKLKLDETQKQIWMIRREYCNEVKQFIEKYGIKATIQCNFENNVRQQLATALDDIHVNSGNNFTEKKKSEEIIRMEREISSEKKVLEDLEKKLKGLHKINQDLQDGQDTVECISLRNALKYSRDETAKYQEELNALQVQLDAMNTNIINNLFDDNPSLGGNQNQIISSQELSAAQNHNSDLNNVVEFMSAKDVYEAARNNINNITTDVIVQPANWQNYRTLPSTSSTQYHVVEIMENSSSVPHVTHSNYSDSFSTGNTTREQTFRNDPYKRIMEIKEKAKLNNKRQKGKFKLVNNEKK